VPNDVSLVIWLKWFCYNWQWCGVCVAVAMMMKMMTDNNHDADVEHQGAALWLPVTLTTIMWLHCLGLLLRVLVVLRLNTTLKLIRPSSSSSSSDCCVVRTSWVAIFSASSRTQTAGRSCGSSLPTFVCFFTKTFRLLFVLQMHVLTIP